MRKRLCHSVAGLSLLICSCISKPSNSPKQIDRESAVARDRRGSPSEYDAVESSDEEAHDDK